MSVDWIIGRKANDSDPGTSPNCPPQASKATEGTSSPGEVRALPASPQNIEHLILEECGAIARMLIDKNRSYGNSALDPVKVFSAATARERLAVRIDDKISRLIRGAEYAGDDTVLDLIGYLVLYRIATKELP